MVDALAEHPAPQHQEATQGQEATQELEATLVQAAAQDQEAQRVNHAGSEARETFPAAATPATPAATGPPKKPSRGKAPRMIYGQTDSIFVHFPGASLDEATARAKLLATEMSAQFSDPLSLKLERVLCPFLLAQVRPHCSPCWFQPGPRHPHELHPQGQRCAGAALGAQAGGGNQD